MVVLKHIRYIRSVNQPEAPPVVLACQLPRHCVTWSPGAWSPGALVGASRQVVMASEQKHH